jgi:hypothetical protein
MMFSIFSVEIKHGNNTIYVFKQPRHIIIFSKLLYVILS